MYRIVVKSMRLLLKLPDEGGGHHVVTLLAAVQVTDIWRLLAGRYHHSNLVQP